MIHSLSSLVAFLFCVCHFPCSGSERKFAILNRFFSHFLTEALSEMVCTNFLMNTFRNNGHKVQDQTIYEMISSGKKFPSKFPSITKSFI